MTKEQEILAFTNKEWGPKKLDRIALKLAEESGEVCGAVHKIDEGRSTLEDLDSEVGDVLIVLSQIAALRETTLEELRAKRFEFIKHRSENLKSKEP